MKPRIIVCGLGRTGYRIFTLLRQQGAAVVGISDRPLAYSQVSDNIIIGEMKASNTLISAGIKDAHTLVLASNDDAINLAILTQAKLINPHIRIINRLFNQALGERLDQTLTDHVSMSVYGLAAPIFSFAALGNQAIGQLHLFNQTWPIHEEIIDENHPWLGLNLSELWENSSRMLVYYLPARDEIDLISAVVQGKKLQIGDHLIIGSEPTRRAKKRSGIKKLLKAIVNIKQFREYGGSLAVVLISLLMMIGICTITYVCVSYHTSMVDALYFSVGLITGAGGQEKVAEKAPDSIKIFTAIMMIVGAAVIGICYALINDFVLGSRLKQFWDAARVPTSNHYIVCGLGGIGILIVRQLVAQGHEVVVIDSDANSRFIQSARSLGVPVIIDDASLVGTLKAANIESSSAILLVTSNDMVNVEIALTAKAVKPKLPVVVRIQETQFVQSVQEVFEFEHVLCPGELATHSFAAAALGGKILGNGMTDDLLWVALATMITPRHPFCGKTVKDASMEADFVPLYLERKAITVHSWHLLETILNSGDVLYITIPATGLDQLWRSNYSQLELSSNI